MACCAGVRRSWCTLAAKLIWVSGSCWTCAGPAVLLYTPPRPGAPGSLPGCPGRPPGAPLAPPLPAPAPLAAWLTPLRSCVWPCVPAGPPWAGSCCWGSMAGAFLLACIRCSSVMLGNSSAALALPTMAPRCSASSSRACHTGFFCSSRAAERVSATLLHCC